MASKVGRCYDILVVIAGYLHPNAKYGRLKPGDYHSYKDLLSFLLVGREAQAAGEQVLYKTIIFPYRTKCEPWVFLDSLQKHSRPVAQLVRVLEASGQGRTCLRRIRDLCINVNDFTIDVTADINCLREEPGPAVFSRLTVRSGTMDGSVWEWLVNIEKASWLASHCRHLKLDGLGLKWEGPIAQAQISSAGQPFMLEALSVFNCTFTEPLIRCLYEPWKGHITTLKIDRPWMGWSQGDAASQILLWQRFIMLFQDTLKHLETFMARYILPGLCLSGFKALEYLVIEQETHSFPLLPHHFAQNLRNLTFDVAVDDPIVAGILQAFQSPKYLPNLRQFPTISLHCNHSYRTYSPHTSSMFCGCREYLKEDIQTAVTALQQRGLVKPSIPYHAADADLWYARVDLEPGVREFFLAVDEGRTAIVAWDKF